MAEEAEWDPEERDVVWAHVHGWGMWPGVVIDVAVINGVVADTEGVYKVEHFGGGGKCYSARDVKNKRIRLFSSMKPRARLANTKDVVYSQADQASYQAAVQEAKESLEQEMPCQSCGIDDESPNILCDVCEACFHLGCLEPPLAAVPAGQWLCCDCKELSVRLGELVESAIAGSLPDWPPVPVPPNDDGDSPPPGDYIEVREDETWRPGRILGHGSKGSVHVQFDDPQPPAGVFRYICKEDETMKSIASELYADPVAAAVKEVLVEFQKTVKSFNPAQTSALQLQIDLKPTKKLGANTCIMLPEYHIVVDEGDTPLSICERFGRDVHALLKLNHERSDDTLLGARLLDSDSPLSEGTILLLPPAKPALYLEQPSPPFGRFTSSREQLSAAIDAACLPLNEGSRLWLETELSDVDGCHEGTGEKVLRMRPATVSSISADGTTFTLMNIAGDKQWDADGVKMEDEGKEWVRMVQWDVEHQLNPRGVVGSGNLIPPFATWHEVRKLLPAQDEWRQRPREPTDGWLSTLNDGDSVEVFFDGAWFQGQLDLHKRQPGGLFAVDLQIDDEPEPYHDVVCAGSQLRPSNDERCQGAPSGSSRPRKRRKLNSASEIAAEEDAFMPDGVEDEDDGDESPPCQCQRSPQCVRGFRHGGVGGPCRIPKVRTLPEEGHDEMLAAALAADDASPEPAAEEEVQPAPEPAPEPTPDPATAGPKAWFVDSWAEVHVKKIKDDEPLSSELLEGAKQVLERRFGDTFSKGLISGFLGLSPFKSDGRHVFRNYRPERVNEQQGNKAGESIFRDVGVAVVVQENASGHCNVIAASCFNLVRTSKRAEPFAMQVLLFAVKESYERQGVARRLESELFRYCSEKGIDSMVVLSGKRTEQDRNWWMLKGGFELPGASAVTSFDELSNPIGGLLGSSVPDSFLLPWNMHKDAMEQKATENAARKQAVQRGLANSEAEVTWDQMHNCGLDQITALIAPVQTWRNAERRDAERRGVARPGAAGAAAAGRPAHTNEEGGAPHDEMEADEDYHQADEDHHQADEDHHGDERFDDDEDAPAEDTGEEEGLEDDEDDEEMDPNLNLEEEEEAPAADEMAAVEAEPLPPAASPTAAQRTARAPDTRKLRVGELMAGSCRLLKKLVKYGCDGLGVERDVNAPEYDGEILKRPTSAVAPPPGTASRELREASKMSPKKKPAAAYLDICMCRDLRPEDLATFDYLHFAPQVAQARHEPPFLLPCSPRSFSPP